jgi:hypothetical protein
MNGFIDHFKTRLGTASNYSATANLHNSQITTASAEPFLARCVFTSRSLVKASNSGDSSASRTQILSSQTLYTTDLVDPIIFLIIPRHGPRRQQRSLSYANRVRGNVFASPSNGLSNPGRCFATVTQQRVHTLQYLYI